MQTNEPKPPVTRNRTRDHLIAAGVYSQMLCQLSYSRRCVMARRCEVQAGIAARSCAKPDAAPGTEARRTDHRSNSDKHAGARSHAKAKACVQTAFAGLDFPVYANPPLPLNGKGKVPKLMDLVFKSTDATC